MQTLFMPTKSASNIKWFSDEYLKSQFEAVLQKYWVLCILGPFLRVFWLHPLPPLRHTLPTAPKDSPSGTEFLIQFWIYNFKLFWSKLDFFWGFSGSRVLGGLGWEKHKINIFLGLAGPIFMKLQCCSILGCCTWCWEIFFLWDSGPSQAPETYFSRSLLVTIWVIFQLQLGYIHQTMMTTDLTISKTWWEFQVNSVNRTKVTSNFMI